MKEKIMKRVTAIFLAALLLLGTAACGDPGVSTPPAATTTAPAETPTSTTTTPPAPTTTVVPETAPPAVTVTLQANDGSGDTDTLVFAADSVYELPSRARDGYVFLGWFTQPEGGQQVMDGDALLSGEDHTLYAHWEVKTVFTVTLDPNGGRISPYDSQLALKDGQTYGTLPEPIREGYTFLGWYTQPEDGTRVRSTAKFTGSEDQVLYAHWEYDALAYWAYVLENRVQQIPQCRRVVVYLERNAGYKTYIDCPFLTDAGAINPAEGLENYKVTDAWIKSVEPYIIVKLTSDTGMALVYKTAMLRRFPNADIYVFSTSAVSGSEKYQLYCRLYLAKVLYPEYFEDVDMNTVKSELNVKATIYH